MWKREAPHQYVPLNYFTLKTHDSGHLTTRMAHWMYPDAWTTALLERRMLCGSSEWPWNCGGGAYWTLTCFNVLRPFLHAPPTHNVCFFKVVLPWRVHSKSMNLVLFDILICCGVHVADPYCFHLFVYRNRIGLQLWRAMRCWESTRRWRREWSDVWFDLELQWTNWISHFMSQCFYHPLSPDFLTNIFVQRYSWNPSVFYYQRWPLY